MYDTAEEMTLPEIHPNSYVMLPDDGGFKKSDNFFIHHIKNKTKICPPRKDVMSLKLSCPLILSIFFFSVSKWGVKPMKHLFQLVTLHVNLGV